MENQQIQKEILNAASISQFAYKKENQLLLLYTNPDGIILEKIKYFDVDDTESVVYHDDTNSTLYVAFRGTSSLMDVLTDINFGCSQFYGMKAHRGFVKAYKKISSAIMETVKNAIADEKLRTNKVVFCGHSLGGALANLAFYHAVSSYSNIFRDSNVTCKLVTYGSPKVFNARQMNSVVSDIFLTHAVRLTHGDDIVTTLPKYSSFMKKVFGIEYIHLGEHLGVGEYPDGKDAFSEHSLKTYIATLSENILV